LLRTADAITGFSAVAMSLFAPVPDFVLVRAMIQRSLFTVPIFVDRNHSTPVLVVVNQTTTNFSEQKTGAWARTYMRTLTTLPTVEKLNGTSSHSFSKML
jgi:hypothetical protein